MITVANPIYDIVFKYLMEDERIARTILSAQTYKSKNSQQVLNIDDSIYAGDAEMEHIIHRLLMAATDANVRQDMNVEDEYFSIIEKRDTEIMMRDRQLAEKNAQLEQKDAQIEQQKAQLKASVLALYKGGMPTEAIAATLQMDVRAVEALLVLQ